MCTGIPLAKQTIKARIRELEETNKPLLEEEYPNDHILPGVLYLLIGCKGRRPISGRVIVL